MTKSEALANLQECTVKIETDSDVGSGFFIEKNVIATCYHVIADCSTNKIQIIWKDTVYNVKSIESNPNEDLALLHVKINKHPCVKVDTELEAFSECSFFGFPKSNREVGIHRTCESESNTGKVLAFKDGQFESGFSGSPILNLKTHRVCGIVDRTRDSYSDLGGYAIPISKLFDFESLDMDDNGSIFSKEMFKSWVWTSSVESADRLQFSVLALVETLVAVGVSFFVWIYYGFYLHIITGLVVAPFFFLRTNKNEKNAFSFFEKNVDNLSIIIFGFFLTISIITLTINSSEKILDSIIPMIFIVILFITYYKLGFKYLFILILANLIKVLFTLKNLSFKQLSMIPFNWFKLILSTDNMHPLEIISSISKSKSIYKTGNIFNMLVSPMDDANPLLLGIMIIPFFIYTIVLYTILIIPMLIFRYSLKSTAWIYLPLIWLIQRQDKQNLNTRLKLESKNFIAYLMFFYSIIVVFVFTFLPIFFPNFIEAYSHNLPQQLELIFFAYPSNFSHEYGIWYFTRFFSALITIVFMFSFTKILIRRETEPSYGDFWGTKLLSLRSVRSVLTLVTLGFTAYHIFGLLPSDFFSDLWGNMKFS